MGMADTFGMAFAKSQLGASVVLPASGTVFISVKDGDKHLMIPLAQNLLKLGFDVVATGGTAKYLQEAGLNVEQVKKVSEGRPHIVDAMKNGQIALVFNTTWGKQALKDSFSIRRAALTAGIPYFTTASGASAAVQAIRSQVTSTGTQALVFSSDSAGALPILAQLLPENGLGPDKVQYMGLTRWDIPASTLATAGLQGGWFTLPDTSAISAFRSRYTSSYGAAPHPLAGFAYDGVAAIGALLATGDSNALTRRKLTRSDGFAGVNGVFRLLPDGTNQRGLAIAEVRDGKAVVISPAPRGFGGSGS